MGICEGVAAILLGGFMAYASWKDYDYNKKYDECSQKVQNIKNIKTAKTHRKNHIAK